MPIPRTCNSGHIPDVCCEPKHVWEKPVSQLPAAGEADRDTMYILPNNTMWVLNYAGTALVQVNAGGGGGQPTEIESTTLDVTGSGTYNVTVNLDQDTQDKLEKAETALQDAPSDGKEYVRKDGDWEELLIESGEEYIGRYSTALFNGAVNDTVTVASSDLVAVVGELKVGGIVYDAEGNIAAVQGINGTNVSLRLITTDTEIETYTASYSGTLSTTIDDTQAVDLDDLTPVTGTVAVVGGLIYDADGTVATIIDVDYTAKTASVQILSINTSGSAYLGYYTSNDAPTLSIVIGDTTIVPIDQVQDKIGTMEIGGSIYDYEGNLGKITAIDTVAGTIDVETVVIGNVLLRFWYQNRTASTAEENNPGWDSWQGGIRTIGFRPPDRAKNGDFGFLYQSKFPSRSVWTKAIKNLAREELEIVAGTSPFNLWHANISITDQPTPSMGDAVGINLWDKVTWAKNLSSYALATAAEVDRYLSIGDMLLGEFTGPDGTYNYIAVVVQRYLASSTPRRRTSSLYFAYIGNAQPSSLGASAAFADIFGSANNPTGKQYSVTVDGITFIWERISNGFYVPKIRNNRTTTITVNYAFDQYYGAVASQQMSGSNITLASGGATGSLETDNYGLGYSSSASSGASLYNGYISIRTDTTRETYNWHTESDTTGTTAPTSGGMSMQVIQRSKLTPQ